MYKYLPTSQRKTIIKDPKMMEKTFGDQIPDNFQFEIQNTVQRCIQEFFISKKYSQISNRECEELTVKIFETMRSFL